ncbi:MAG TPA: nitroreductase family protein [Anaerolineales bacterium]
MQPNLLENPWKPPLDLIHRLTSARRYKTEPLPASVIETIITAAQCASTSSNLQTYSVVIATDAGKRVQLSKMCGNQAHIRDAPVFLAWCAELATRERVCQLRGYTQVTVYAEYFLVAALDVSIAAQNAALAAESLGLVFATSAAFATTRPKSSNCSACLG